MAELLAIMARLRDRGHGCPWDVAQTFDTIAPYTIEEAYEVADAIDRKDHAALKDELGDLLLQVVFHARIAEEHGLFDFGGVVEAINAKLVRRHPHVFADAHYADAEEQSRAWEDIKRAERAAAWGRAQRTGRSGLRARTRSAAESNRSMGDGTSTNRVGPEAPCGTTEPPCVRRI